MSMSKVSMMCKVSHVTITVHSFAYKMHWIILYLVHSPYIVSLWYNMIYTVYIITGNRKRATSPLERHTTASPIPYISVTYHILCHIWSLLILGGFLPIFGQFPGSWLVETQNPWLWLVHSCQGHHDEQRQFWRKSLFLEAHSLTGNSSGSYGFYIRNSAIWPL